MAERQRTRRAYNSPRRRQQALATRRAILEAAERLFVSDGYPSTTMEAIATEAGVSLKTVYAPFSTKSGLLRALWDLRLKGDDDSPPVTQHEWFREVMEERDPVRKLQLNARNSRAAKTRVGGMFQVIRSAAAIDADCAALWQLIQADFHANQRTIVESIHRRDGLRRTLGVGRATDILWALNHPDVWALLVVERGWSPHAYETWLAQASCEQLLGPADAGDDSALIARELAVTSDEVPDTLAAVAEWLPASDAERGAALRDLLSLVDAIPGRPRQGGVTFPRINSRARR